jgi:hypothetical protein
VGDEERCDSCFFTKPQTVHDWDLLPLALKKLGTTRDALLAEFMQTAPIVFRQGFDQYVCTQCPVDECPNTRCVCLGDNSIRKDFELPVRGLCCAARGRDTEDRCRGCQKWAAANALVALMGIVKYRKVGLPYDVVRFVVARSILWPEAQHWLAFRETKMKKK